ncbi:MAG TPA: hypothetical protein VFZ09_40415 [Archangium sp.]|nr:hypothetical protein [Archangium sp.]HEX5752539.1 hypothetical protein [Archangium sp.]
MSLTEENSQVLHLVQAMMGAITPDFRRGTLKPIGSDRRPQVRR